MLIQYRAQSAGGPSFRALCERVGFLAEGVL
jgi:hypothetical protein